MLTLRPVNEKNVWELLKLSVAEDQKSFVATNTESIVEAYTTVASGGVALPFGIYEDETPVGFVMIGYEEDVSALIPSVHGAAYSLWRFMIDERYQGRGLGRKTLPMILDYVRKRPAGDADCCYLSYEPGNERAKKLYADFGFRETGDMDEDEIIAVLSIQE